MPIGFKLACETRDAPSLVSEAVAAEQAGFDFGFISDHYHPWTRRQGQSPMVWGVIGAIAAATDRLQVTTGVTCPTIRIHPAIVAQAAATSATLLPGRFALGVGSGERLNEHILGDRWPPTGVRHDMLEEAVGIIRELWTGRQVSHHGPHYTVDNARVFSLPEQPPPIYVAASGTNAAALAARSGDGLIATSANRELVEAYRQAGGEEPIIGEVAVCYGPDEEQAAQQAHDWWPNAAIPGELTQELATPAHFEQAAQAVSVDDIAASVACGPDPDRHVAAVGEYLEAGFTDVAVNQVVPGVEGLFDFYAEEVLPRL